MRELRKGTLLSARSERHLVNVLSMLEVTHRVSPVVICSRLVHPIGCSWCYRSGGAGAELQARSILLPSAGDGLGQALGEFIELVIHDFPFGFSCLIGVV